MSINAKLEDKGYLEFTCPLEGCEKLIKLPIAFHTIFDKTDKYTGPIYHLEHKDLEKLSIKETLRNVCDCNTVSYKITQGEVSFI